MHFHIVGVDPGLVHTGVVRLIFDNTTHEIHVAHEAIIGPDAQAVEDFVYADLPYPGPSVFIEAYRPRSHFDSDEQMLKAIADLRQHLPSATVLPNTGVKKIVKPDLMRLLGAWGFATPTHHQDLRSAARIAILGMLKNEITNHLLARVVADHLHGKPWQVHN